MQLVTLDPTIRLLGFKKYLDDVITSCLSYVVNASQHSENTPALRVMLCCMSYGKLLKQYIVQSLFSQAESFQRQDRSSCMVWYEVLFTFE